MRTLLFISLAAALLVGGTAFAQEESSDATEVTLQDLGIEDAGLLPTSPFYIFKEIGRDFRRFITFNPIARAELELKVTNEKAAEAKKVEESGGNAQAISRALANYESAQERLKVRLEALRETSENPNIDELLTKVTERSVLHERLFGELQDKVQDNDQVEAVRKRISETVEQAIRNDDPERLKERLERAFDSAKGNDLRDVNAVDILNRLQNVPQEARVKILELKEEAASRLHDRLEDEVESGDAEGLRERIKKAVGNSIEGSALIEELRFRASNALSDVLTRAQEDIDESSGDDIAKKAQEVIAEVERYLVKAQEVASGNENATGAVREVLTEAERNIQAAKEALRVSEYGKAIELARTAHAALRSLESRLRGADTSEPVQVLERVKTQLRQLLPAPSGQSSTGSSEGTVCTLEYAPVCGTDGETYSNECFAKASGARIADRGACDDTTSKGEGGVNSGSGSANLKTQMVESLRAKASEILSPGTGFGGSRFGESEFGE